MSDDGYARSVSGKKINLSPSSASEFALCPLKWWKAKIRDEDEGPKDDTLTFGTAVHHVAETWLGKGVICPPGIYRDERGKEDIDVTAEHVARFRPAIAMLPDPGVGNTEMWSDKLEIYEGPEGRMNFSGKIDWHDYRSSWAPPGYEGFKGLIVLDHKTKKNPVGKFGIPDPETLNRDIQGRLYAYERAQALGVPFDPVLFVHNYIIKTGPPKAVLVSTLITPMQFTATWEAQGGVAAQMLRVAKAEKAEDVPFNKANCWAFGKPCPFKQTCHAHNRIGGFFSNLRGFDTQATETETPDTQTTEDNMSIMDRFKAAQKAANPAPATKAATKPEQVAETAPVADTPAVPGAGSALQAPDVEPHDDDTVRPALLKDVVRECLAAYERINTGGSPGAGRRPLSYEVIRSYAAQAGLHVRWAPNVAALVSRAGAGVHMTANGPALDGLLDMDEDRLLTVPAAELTALDQDEPSSDEERLNAFINLPLEAFRGMVASQPRDMLLLARARVDEQRQALIDKILDDGRFVTPFDDHEWRGALRALWVRVLGGEELTSTDVDRVCKTHGVYKNKSQKKIDEIQVMLRDAPRPGAEVQVPRVDVDPKGILEMRTVDDLIAGHDEATRDHLRALIAAHVARNASVTVKVVPGPERVVEVVKEVPGPERIVEVVKEVPVEGASVAPTTIYLGCYVKGAEPLTDMPLVRNAVDVVNYSVKDKVPSWILYSDYADTGAKRLTVALKHTLANNPLPGGDWWLPFRSELSDIPIGELFEAAGARVVYRLG